MLYKETMYITYNGNGFITKSTDCSISSISCPARCYNGLTVIPITNGDVICRCTDEQL